MGEMGEDLGMDAGGGIAKAGCREAIERARCTDVFCSAWPALNPTVALRLSIPEFEVSGKLVSDGEGDSSTGDMVASGSSNMSPRRRSLALSSTESGTSLRIRLNFLTLRMMLIFTLAWCLGVGDVPRSE